MMTADDISDALHGLAYGMLENFRDDDPRDKLRESFMAYAEQQIFEFDEGDEGDEAHQRHAFRQQAVAVFAEVWADLHGDS